MANANAIRLSEPIKNVVLTGVPGVGKTTLIKRVCDKLEEMGFSCQGFYTEEIREEGQRVGFDVVTLDGQRGQLARMVDRDNPRGGRTYMVGRYSVQLQSFEMVALPSLRVKPEEITKVVVIDEIGKMEMFSPSFVQTVRNLLKHPKVTVLATIPVKANPFVEEIRHNENVVLYTVTKENRYSLIDDVADSIKDSVETYGT